MRTAIPYLSTIFLVCCFSFSCGVSSKKAGGTHTGTSSKAVKLYNAGKLESAKGRYEDAIRYLDKAIKMDPNYKDALIIRGDAYIALKNNDKAISDLKKVVELDPGYKPKVLYSLGRIEHDEAQYENSAKHLEAFLKYPITSERLERAAKDYLANSRFAAKATSNPVPFDPKSMGPMINSPRSEYLPSITADEETILFTVKLGRQEDFWISKKVNGAWVQAKDLGAPINTAENEGAQSLSADGRHLVYTACNRRSDFGSCDLYYAYPRANGQWSIPKNMGAIINTSSWESQPSLSVNGNKLFFASNRRGGEGGKDIWMAEKDENGKWKKPQPLSDIINTRGNEQCPFFHADGRTLYFSSDHHPGMGKADFFKTILQEDGSWSKPINLGYPINTVSNEISLIVGIDGSTAYFASDRPGGLGGTDLYSFELYEKIRADKSTYVKCTVIDKKTKKPLMANVNMHRINGKQGSYSFKTDDQGAFLVTLPIGTSYALSVDKKDYLFHSENFDLLDVAESSLKPVELIIELSPIPPQIVQPNIGAAPVIDTKPIVLKNVFFATGSAELESSSAYELNNLFELLQSYPQMRIQINGHTDNVGDDSSNKTLSERRAQSVLNYLVNKGIDASRLSAKGFGETMPVDDNSTEEGRQNNRRTEFQVK